jgi:O-antigen ligase/Flp pilus assembly protein TadD
MKPSDAGQRPESPVLAVTSLVLLAGCVFVIVPDGLFRFALPKAALLAAGVALGILSFSRTRLAPQVAWAAAGVLAVFAGAAVVQDGLGPTFWGRWPRYEGVPMVAAYLLLQVVGARLLGPGASPVVRAWWTRLVAGSMVLLVILVTLNAAGLSLPESDGFRFGATLGNATDMGILGLTGCALLLPLAVRRRAPWAVMGSASGVAVALASGSRAVLLTLSVLVVATLAWRVRESRGSGSRRIAGWWPLAALALIALIVLILPAARDRLLITGTVTGRLDLWAATLGLVGENWLLGVGPGHFVDALPRYQSEEFAARVGTDFPADSPHMIPLQWLADGGVPLLLANALLCFAVLWAGARNIRRNSDENEALFLAGAMAAVCSFGFVLLTHFPSPGTTVIAGLSAGAIAAVVPGTAAGKRGRNRPAAPPRPKNLPTQRAAKIASWTAASGLALAAAFGAAASLAERHLKAADAAVRSGQLTEAATQFETAAALRPWDADVALLAGQAFAGRAAAGDPGSGTHAADWSARSLRLNPGSVESMTSLAVGQLATGDIDGAKATLAAARTAAPVNSQLWLQSGLAAYADGELDEAEDFVERAAALTPEPAQVQSILAAIRQEAGRP